MRLFKYFCRLSLDSHKICCFLLRFEEMIRAHAIDFTELYREGGFDTGNSGEQRHRRQSGKLKRPGGFLFSVTAI
ncbi:MAG: hypothetical protein GXP51_10930 [Deltaproteobacteria bacterium]|nr:hypothetical protein [Deltaproteobacteria bacterium]